MTMALYLHIENIQIIHQQRLRVGKHRAFRDRLNPLDAYDDEEIIKRYRLSRQLIMNLYDQIGDQLEPSTNRNHAFQAMLHIFCALHYYACGSYQNVVGDSIGVHRSSVSRIVRRVTAKMCNLRHRYIQFPRTSEHVIFGQ